MNLTLIAFIFVIAIIFNKYFGVKQQMKLHKQLQALKKTGYAVGVGIGKSIWGSSVGVIVCESEKGDIEAFYSVKGRLINSSFEKDDNVTFSTCEALISAYSDIKLSNQQKAYLQAASFIEKGLKEKREKEEGSDE